MSGITDIFSRALDSLYHDLRDIAYERNERISYITLRRRIAENWFIELQYFH